MQIPKDTILSFIQQRMGGEQATQADAQLPDQVDPERHADLLSQLGLDPHELLSHVSGHGGQGLASKAESFLGGGGFGGQSQ
jgi:hypothetical protein